MPTTLTPEQYFEPYMYDGIRPQPYWIQCVEGKIEAPAGEFKFFPMEQHILAGPNGCGKTTILSLIAALHEIMRGGNPRILNQLHYRADYEKFFDYITITLVNGTTATLRTDNDTKGNFIFTCGDLTASFRLPWEKGYATMKPFVVANCTLLSGDRHCEYPSTVMNILREAAIPEFDADDINRFIEHFMFGDKYPVPGKHPCDDFPEVNPGIFSPTNLAQVSDWLIRKGHGEKELFTLQLACQKSGLVLVDDAEGGLHITVQEKYNRLLAFYAAKYGTQVIFSTHAPSMVMEARDRIVDLLP